MTGHAHGDHGPGSRAAAPGPGATGAGLVPSKTSGDIFINLGPSAVAERRISRLKRSVWASGHLHGLAERGHRPDRCWFVTLTYRPGCEWHAGHIAAALKRFRQWCKDHGAPCRYTWVAELQKRGAVHYHLLAWLPRRLAMPKWDRGGARRSAFWPHGMSNTQVARAGVGYLMKYLSKLGELHRFPKGLRLYGIGGLSALGRSVRQWFNLPEWAKADYGVGELARAACGLVVRATGEVLAPRWKVQRVPSGIALRQLLPVGQRWFAGAYSRVNFGHVA